MIVAESTQQKKVLIIDDREHICDEDYGEP